MVRFLFILFLILVVSISAIADSLKDEFMKVCTNQKFDQPELMALGALKFKLYRSCIHDPKCKQEDGNFFGREKECKGIFDRYSHYQVMVMPKSGISDMTIMRFFPQVNDLFLAENNITNLDFVKYLPKLSRLDIWGNPIETIEPLRGKDLTHLTFWSQDSNLTALENMSDLETLAASAHFSDVSPIANLTQLRDLSLVSSNIVNNYCLLNGLTKLNSLYLSSPKLNENDIRCLDKLINLREITLHHGQIKTVEFAKIFPYLKEIKLHHNPINDISPLNKLKNLEYVSVDKENLKWCSPRDVKEIKAGISCGNFAITNFFKRLWLYL